MPTTKEPPKERGTRRPASRDASNDTSTESHQARRVRPRVRLRCIASILAVVVVAIVLDVGLSLALQPYGTSTEIMWHDYRSAADEDMETLVLGSSCAQLGINPLVLGEQIDSSTFNMATFSQPFSSSLDALNAAMTSHDIKRVVLCLGTASLVDPPQYDRQITFMQAKSLGEPLPSVMQNVSHVALDEDYFSTSKSLAWMFPWVFESVEFSADAISTNVKNRLSGEAPDAFVDAFDSDWKHVGRGYCGHRRAIDLQALSTDTIAVDRDFVFGERNMRDFGTLLDACRDHGIEVWVAAAPQTSFANLQMECSEYRAALREFQSFVLAHGGIYCDLNFAKPDFYRPHDEEFTDMLHLNLDGANRFSKALGTVIAQADAGKNTDDLFFSYDEWDEHLAMYDEVVLCTCNTTIQNEHIHCAASAVTRPGVEVEYEFGLATGSSHDKDVAFEVLRAYDADSAFDFTLPGQGTYTLRIVSRAKGATSQSDTRVFYQTLRL